MPTTSVALTPKSFRNPGHDLPMIRVRHAAPEDLPRMLEIAKRAVTAAQWTESQYQQMFSSSRLAMVIEENAQVLGFIVGRGTAGEWEIENIAISDSGRRRGLGSRLLGKFLHHIRNSGAEQVFLEVRESNYAARLLYEKWAFIEAGRRKSYYRDPQE